MKNFVREDKRSHLGDLPEEMILEIFKFVEITSLSLVRLGGVNKEWKNIISRDEYWIRVLKTDHLEYSEDVMKIVTFSGSVSGEDTSKEMYKLIYKNICLCLHAKSICEMPKMDKKKGDAMQIVVLGEDAVGKSSLIDQIALNHCLDWDPGRDDSFWSHVFVIDEKYKLKIMDRSGYREYTALMDVDMRVGDGFLVCFDLTDPKSIELCHEVCHQISVVRKVESCDVPIVLVGCKKDGMTDMTEKLSKEFLEEIEKLVQTHHCQYIETSAKTGENVVSAFSMVARRVKGFSPKEIEDFASGKNSLNSFTIPKPGDKQGDKCCVL